VIKGRDSYKFSLRGFYIKPNSRAIIEVAA